MEDGGHKYNVKRARSKSMIRMTVLMKLVLPMLLFPSFGSPADLGMAGKRFCITTRKLAWNI